MKHILSTCFAAILVLGLGIEVIVGLPEEVIAEKDEIYTAEKELQYKFNPSNLYTIDLTKELLRKNPKTIVLPCLFGLLDSL